MLQNVITIDLYSATEAELNYVRDAVGIRLANLTTEKVAIRDLQVGKLRIAINGFYNEGETFNGKVAAIKWVRAKSACDLKSAKDLVEAVWAGAEFLPNLCVVGLGKAVRDIDWNL